MALRIPKQRRWDSWVSASAKRNTAVRVISSVYVQGSLAHGNTMSVLWMGAIPKGTITYQWIRGASTNIVGATNPTYVSTVTDVGNTLKCKVTVSGKTNSVVTTPATGNIT